MSGRSAGQLISPADIQARLAQHLPQWTFHDGHLCRTCRTGQWPKTVMLFNAVAYLAEQADHHPDITARYGSLEIRLTTHSAGGVTGKDFDLAARIEALAT